MGLKRLLLVTAMSVAVFWLAASPADSNTRVVAKPRVLAAGEEREAPGEGRLVADARGDTVVFWIVDGEVAAAVHRAGHHAWRVVARAGGQAPLPRTGAPPLFDSEPVVAIQAAMGAHGDAVVAWERSGRGEGYTIEAVTFDVATERWGRPSQLFTQREELLAPLTVAIDARGDAIVAWEGEPPGKRGPDVVLAATKSASEQWQPAVMLSALTGEGEDPRVAIDEAGDGLVVWEEHQAIEGRSTPRERSEVVQAASISAGGQWTTAADLSPLDQQDEHPVPALDASGAAVVVWESVEVEEPRSVPRIAYEETTRVNAVRRDGRDGDWTTPAQLSHNLGEFAAEPAVAMAPNGVAMVTWQDDEPDENTVYVAAHAGGIGWRTPLAVARWRHIAAPTEPECAAAITCDPPAIRRLPGAEPEVALSSRHAVVVWRPADAYEAEIESTNVSLAGVLGPSWRLSTPSASQVQLALGRRGQTLAAWTRVLEDNSHYETAIEVAEMKP